jgi:MFS family permease
MSPLLFALFLATFAIGTTEFAVVGLLPDIATSLDASISQAGLLVSGYAIGVAVGGRSLSGSPRRSHASGRFCSSARSSSRVMLLLRSRRTMVG